MPISLSHEILKSNTVKSQNWMLSFYIGLINACWTRSLIPSIVIELYYVPYTNPKTGNRAEV